MFTRGFQIFAAVIQIVGQEGNLHHEYDKTNCCGIVGGNHPATTGPGPNECHGHQCRLFGDAQQRGGIVHLDRFRTSTSCRSCQRPDLDHNGHPKQFLCDNDGKQFAGDGH